MIVEHLDLHCVLGLVIGVASGNGRRHVLNNLVPIDIAAVRVVDIILRELQGIRGQQAHGLGIPGLHLGSFESLRVAVNTELRGGLRGRRHRELRTVLRERRCVKRSHRKAESTAGASRAVECLLDLQAGFRAVINRINLVLVLKRNRGLAVIGLQARDRLHIVGLGVKLRNSISRQRINVVALANERRHARALHDGRLGVELAFVVRIRLHRNEHVGIAGVRGVERAAITVGPMTLGHLVHVRLVVAQLRELQRGELARHRGGL